jgi:hypothetical protein
MKHIGQSSDEHTAGSFDVAEDMPSFTPGSDLGAEFSFPISNCFKKHITVGSGLDFGDLKEDFSQVPGVGRSGRSATPGQALPLNVNQAALYDGIRPEPADYPHHRPVAVYGEATRVQPGLFQTGEVPGQLRGRIFRDTVFTSYKRVCFGIHQSYQAVRPVQECPIKDEMMVRRQIHNVFWRRLLQIVVDHTVKCPLAMAALCGQLPDRISFNDPEPEQCPFPVTSSFLPLTVAAKRALARRTEPTLFSFGIMAVFPQYLCTEGTVFFSS